MMPCMIGTSLGRYRVVESLGEGGMGRVFLAEDPALGRKVAVKVLPSEFTHDHERRERLLHEARAASALNHPNIVVIHDLGEQDGVLFVAMERIDGETLREWGRREGRMPLEVLGLFRQALRALAAAHDAGLVHRDLKPENIMVRRDGLLKILDFGLARSVSPGTADRTSTMPGTVLGTAPYMSPEQVLGQPAGPPSDIFSIGTMLYELLTGRHPFAAGSAIEIMHRILHETPEAPSRVNRALSSDFDFVLAKALSKDPRRRHASALDLDVDLETLECGCGPAAIASAAEFESAGAPRVLAVLPFKNIGGDPALNYLGVGLADAVITRLSTSPDLIVRATSAIARYENQAVEPRRVGQELEVSVVLDASFQRAGDRFRATARLVETPSDRSLWAGKIDVRFDDIFDVQDQVAHGIAEALTARLTTAEGAASSSGPEAPAPEAYRYFLRGQEQMRESTREGVNAAIRSLEQAVQIAPGFAKAWAHLGDYYHAQIDGAFDPDPIWYVRAEEALARARALDPTDPHAIFLSGTMHLVRGRKREAYSDLAEALRRTPHLWNVYHFFAYLLRLSDMLEEAAAAELRAIELEPGLQWLYGQMVRITLQRGDLSGARTWADRIRSRFPQSVRSKKYELMILSREERFEDIVAGVERGAYGANEGLYINEAVALAYVKIGKPSLALPYLATLERYADVDMDAAAELAVYHAHAGNPDLAFAALERARALGHDTVSVYKNRSLYGPVMSDPRWAPFLASAEERAAQFRREFRWPPA